MKPKPNQKSTEVLDSSGDSKPLKMYSLRNGKEKIEFEEIDYEEGIEHESDSAAIRRSKRDRKISIKILKQLIENENTSPAPPPLSPPIIIEPPTEILGESCFPPYPRVLKSSSFIPFDLSLVDFGIEMQNKISTVANKSVNGRVRKINPHYTSQTISHFTDLVNHSPTPLSPLTTTTTTTTTNTDIPLTHNLRKNNHNNNNYTANKTGIDILNHNCFIKKNNSNNKKRTREDTTAGHIANEILVESTREKATQQETETAIMPLAKKRKINPNGTTIATTTGLVPISKSNSHKLSTSNKKKKKQR